MSSINDISIALNTLFLDIRNPMTLGLNKNEFFETYGQLYFRHEEGAEFEFSVNPIITFDNKDERIEILQKELQLAQRFQDSTNKSQINALLVEEDNTLTLDNFRLDYSVEISADKVLIIFDTNSLIFKYEVIG